MTDRMRTQMIDRYRGGLMSRGEEERFRERLAADPRLDQMLKANDLVESAFRNDVAMISTDHAITRARAMDALSRVSQHGTLSGGAAAGSRGLGLGGSAVVKIVVSSLVAVGLAVGVYTFWPSGTSTEQIAKPTPTIENATPSSTQQIAMPQQNIARPESTRAIESGAPAQDQSVTNGAVRSDARDRQQSAREHGVAEQAASKQEKPAQVEQAKAQTPPRELPVHDKPNVNLKIEVKDNKNK